MKICVTSLPLKLCSGNGTKAKNYNSNLQWPLQIKWMRGTCYKWDLPKHISGRLSIGWLLLVIQKSYYEETEGRLGSDRTPKATVVH
jgi:hypothetical protein